jgi:2-(3-amino-3-carboxypropyl)histidine synthase
MESERKVKILKGIDFRKIFEELEGRKARRVGIQLPDGLKFFAKEIVERFEKRGFHTIISGKRSYGACDIDFDLLKEVDVLVHFAHLPIKPLKDVIFAPYLYDFNVELISKWIKEVKEKEVTLAGTAHYAWKFPELKKVIESRGIKVRLEKPKGRVRLPGQILGCDYSVLGKSEAILVIGDGEFHAKGAAIYTGKKVYFFNPLTDEFKVIGKELIDRFLRIRFLKISKAMELTGSGVGIIVSSKFGQKRLELAKKLKEISQKKGMISGIVYLDDVSFESLASFPFGFFVNTACPRITYDDLEGFEKPILSPQEFEILIGLRDWKGYEMDGM